MGKEMSALSMRLRGLEKGWLPIIGDVYRLILTPDERAEILAVLEERAANRARIAFVSHIIDGMGEHDFHEDAYAHALEHNREEPNEDDYYAVISFALDAARQQGGARG